MDASTTRRHFLGMLAAIAAAPSGAATVASSAPQGNTSHRQFILSPASDDVTPFTVHIPQAALDDLRHRLSLARWTDRETVDDWSQGVPLARAESFIDYWRSHYDWRKFETRLNSFPQFRTRIDGVGIHFIHVRSPHPNALPIILTHGWPGSIVEFLDTIERLTDPVKFGGRPEDAFHVVVPSLPGYGFSDKPTESGWNPARIAKAWVVLMQERLGYSRWVAQGGDWGSIVTHVLARDRPSGLLAAHVNFPLVLPKTLPAHLSKAEESALQSMTQFINTQAGYSDIQSTRPQTVSYALNDSPTGWGLWVYEKFQAWTDNRGLPEDALTRDQMLDDISLYWFTGTIGSSARLYWEAFGGNTFPLANFAFGNIELPMSASIFPREIYRAPRSWGEAAWPNLFYWNEVDRGGHFAAFEQPALFAREMWQAFAKMRA